jgi:hypothetical protein
VIIVSLLLIGGAVGLLLLGLWQPSSALLSASIGASLLAVVVMVIGARRPGDGDNEFALDRQPRHAADRTRGEQEPAPETMRLLNLLPAGIGPHDRPESAYPIGNAAAPPPSADGDQGRRELPGWPRQERDDLPAYAPNSGMNMSRDPVDVSSSAGEPAAGDQLLASRTESRDIGAIPQQGREPAGTPPAGQRVSGEDDPALPADPHDVSLPADPHDVSLPADPDGAYLAGEPDDAYLADEPGIQQVSTADAVRVSRMSTEVLVVDGRPRYHLAGCVHLLGRDSEPLPVAEAVELGFSPCSLCEPDSALLANARHR